MLNTSEQIDHLKLSAKHAGLELPAVQLPESHHTVVGRMRLHYLDWGTKDRHPILFLHGGGLNAHTWDLVCLMLRDRYHCIALDQRGHGDSEWEPTADYRFDAQVADLEGFIEKLKLTRPLLVGHSMGGFAAMGYAIRHAASMAGLVLVDIAPEISMTGSLRIRDFIKGDRELDSVEDFVEKAGDHDGNPLVFFLQFFHAANQTFFILEDDLTTYRKPVHDLCRVHEVFIAHLAIAEMQVAIFGHNLGNLLQSRVCAYVVKSPGHVGQHGKVFPDTLQIASAM